jgi:two-component system sensor histidine kinase/response regulator
VTVLVVEDNAINRQVAREILEGAGHSVVVAGDGREALEQLETGPVDLVLMDVQMPEMDGFEATRAIRAHPRWSAVPVVAMTASVLERDRAEAFAAGMDDHVVKPVDPTGLLAAVRRWTAGDTLASSSGAGAAVSARLAGAALPGRIHGVDVASGLARVGGNDELYESLLREFVETHAVARLEVRDMISRGREVDALRVVHGVKGAAGTIGAAGLGGAASLLEACLRKGCADELPLFLERFEAAIDAVLDGLRSALPAAPTDACRAASTAAPSPQSAAATVATLARLLAAGNIEASEVVSGLREVFCAAGLRDDFDHLVRLVHAYDFDRALERLAAAAPRLAGPAAGGSDG